MGPHLMDHLLGSVSLRAGEDVEVPRVTDDVEEIYIIRVGKEKERSEKRRKKEVKESAARGGGVSSQCSWSCLLYTSPSPRDLSTSRMPSSA